MHAASIQLRWALVFFVVVFGGALLLSSQLAGAAPDGMQLWNEDFTRKASAARDGGVIGITATDLVTSGGTNSATVSDPTNPLDTIVVVLFDDGTHSDPTANDRVFYGTFTVLNDNGTSGSRTNGSAGAIDIAEGDPVSVRVDLDGDGSYSETTIGTDYHGPGMLVPFEGGFVSGQIIITVTIIVEGDAEVDPTSITYSLDLGPAVPFDQIAPLTWRAVIDTFNLTDGPHTVTTNAGDVAGNLDSNTIDFIADNTVPDILHVGSRIARNGDVLIDTAVGDRYLDCRTVVWRFDDEPFEPAQLESAGNFVSCFTMTIPFDDLVPGDHAIEVNARDLANNSMTRITRFNLPEPRVDLLVVDLNDSRPLEPVACSTIAIPIDVWNKGPVPIDLKADLQLDNIVRETRQFRVLGMSCETVAIDLSELTFGDHELDVTLTAPDTVFGDEPFLRLPVTTGDGDSFFVDVPEIYINDDNASYFPVDLSLVRPGQGFVIDGTIHHSELLDDQNCTVEVTMDEETAEFLRTHVNLTGNESYFRIDVPNVTEGTHDVGLNLYLPGMVSPDEPVGTLPVRDLDGGPFSVDNVSLFLDEGTRPLRVSVADTRPGDTVTVRTWVGTHEWIGVYSMWVDLVVDGEVVDRVRGTIRGNTSGKEFELDWTKVTPGPHDVQVRLYAEDHELGLVPIETRQVRDRDGRSIGIFPFRLELDEGSERLPELSSYYNPGDTLVVPTSVFSYERPGEYNFTVQLVVDGKVVDSRDGTHPGDATSIPLELRWENVTTGKHNVTLQLLTPELTGSDEPWQELYVKDAQGLELDVDLDMDLIDGETLFRVDTGGVRPGDDLTVRAGVMNWEREGMYPYTVQLVVDGQVVDTVTGVGRGNATADRHDLTWRNVTSGGHDVKLVLLAPDGTGAQTPVDSRNITDLEDGRVFIEPPRLSLGDGEGFLKVPASRLLPGDTLVVDVPVTCEEDEGLFHFTLQLTVDDLVIDEADGTFDASVTVTRSIPLQWMEVTEGGHAIWVSLWFDDVNTSEEPDVMVEVLDENGDPISIAGPDAVGDPDGGGSTTEAPLPFLQPVYDIVPLEKLPEGSRPWVVPALFLGALLGAGYIVGRRPRTPKGTGKATKTRSGSSPKTGKKPSTTDAKDSSKGKTTIDYPDVSKTPSPGGPVPVPYPNTAMTSDNVTGTKKVKVKGKDGSPQGIKSKGSDSAGGGPETPLEGGKTSPSGPGTSPSSGNTKYDNPGWHTTLPGSSGSGGDLGSGGGQSSVGSGSKYDMAKQGHPEPSGHDPDKSMGHAIRATSVRGEGGQPMDVGDLDLED